MANAIALLVFILVMLGSVLRGHRDMPEAR
jgi:hypothetical protein